MLEKKILKCCQNINVILILSTIGKGRVPWFEKNWIPFIQWCFVQSLIDLSNGPGEENENIKCV